MKRFARTLTGLGSLLALLVAAGGTASAQPVAKGAITYIGTLPAEPPARVAVVVEGDRFLAYCCGQTDDFNKAASAWFSGTVKNGRLEATVDGKTLSAALVGGTVRGSVAIAGRDREFAAKPVAPTAIAGLYRATREANGDTVVMGWIVDAQHQVVGGCQSKKYPPVALKPAKPLPAPPPAPPADEPAPEPPVEQKQQAEEALIGQFEVEPGVSLQGEKVASAVKPPAGKVVLASKR